jgi:hypothetical protein
MLRANKQDVSHFIKMFPYELKDLVDFNGIGFVKSVGIETKDIYYGHCSIRWTKGQEVPETFFGHIWSLWHTLNQGQGSSTNFFWTVETKKKDLQYLSAQTTWFPIKQQTWEKNENVCEPDLMMIQCLNISMLLTKIKRNFVLFNTCYH